MKRKIIMMVIGLLAGIEAVAQASAQTQSQRYEQRYNLLVSQFGPAGVGIETVLDNWEKVDSTNAAMLFGRFNFLFTKAQTSKVVTRPEKKYLGMDPVLTLKDSLGNDVHYYQVNEFDDELYGKAMSVIDRAIRSHPDRLDFRYLKANAYIAYEKESPDMALAYLLELVREGASKNRKWDYEGEKVDSEFFGDTMQEYCYSFYTIGSPAALDAFLKLSTTLSELYPENIGFMNNIGSYYMAAKEDYKTALKYYSKVLKRRPDDITAIKNSVLASRKMNNVKSEKKYLEMLVKYGSEKDSLMAQGRLKALGSK